MAENSRQNGSKDAKQLEEDRLNQAVGEIEKAVKQAFPDATIVPQEQVSQFLEWLTDTCRYQNGS